MLLVVDINVLPLSKDTLHYKEKINVLPLQAIIVTRINYIEVPEVCFGWS